MNRLQRVAHGINVIHLLLIWILLVPVAIEGCTGKEAAAVIEKDEQISTDVTLRKTTKCIVDYEKIKEDYSGEMGLEVDLIVGNRRVRLVGFEPSIASVETDTYYKATWVRLNVGSRHCPSWLMLCFEPDTVHGVLLMDRQPFVRPSTICTWEIGVWYGPQMTEIKGDTVYVEPGFWEELEQKGAVPRGAQKVTEVVYDNEHRPVPQVDGCLCFDSEGDFDKILGAVKGKYVDDATWMLGPVPQALVFSATGNGKARHGDTIKKLAENMARKATPDEHEIVYGIVGAKRGLLILKVKGFKVVEAKFLATPRPEPATRPAEDN